MFRCVCLAANPTWTCMVTVYNSIVLLNESLLFLKPVNRVVAYMQLKILASD